MLRRFFDRRGHHVDLFPSDLSGPEVVTESESLSFRISTGSALTAHTLEVLMSSI